jgi:KDO2-lipid IV(A) lauroyltransferase
VALLGDRDLSGSGVHVQLFGETASLPAGPALLSMTTGAPLHPVTMWFDGELTRAYVHDRIEVPTGLDRDAAVVAMTQQIADAHAEGIRKHSRDWHMLQKVWLADVSRTRVAA